MILPKALVAASTKPMLLAVLSQGESYGYQIIKRLNDLSGGKFKWNDGTLYPVLHTMEAEGLVTSAWRLSESGRQRKYYRLTPKGREAMEVEKQQWLDVHGLLMQLWGTQPAPA